jgi:hypothetical protein
VRLAYRSLEPPGEMIPLHVIEHQPTLLPSTGPFGRGACDGSGRGVGPPTMLLGRCSRCGPGVVNAGYPDHDFACTSGVIGRVR